MVLKGLPLNFKPFTMVITQKKTLTFSEFKVCLRSYEETDHMCYPHMNLTIYHKWRPHFKRLTQGINLVSTYSCYDYKLTNYNYNNYQKLQHSREDYKKTHPQRKTNIICCVYGKRGHKAFEYKNRRPKDFCQNIWTYSIGQTYFFALGYDIVSNE